MHALRFVLLLAVALLLSCDLGGPGPFGQPPEAVTVEASLDGLTITVTWTAAAGADSYRAELVDKDISRHPRSTVGTRETQTQFTEAQGVRANRTYTLTVFSINQSGETPSTNKPTVST